MSNFYSKDKDSCCKLRQFTQSSPLPRPAELVFLQSESNLSLGMETAVPKRLYPGCEGKGCVTQFYLC